MAFFSATYPEQMGRFESRWMKEPVRIQVTPEHRVSETIDNYYILSDKRDKTDTARRIIRLLNPASALLFLNDTDNIANWESKLSYEGFTVETLYGDADKQRRAATLARFRDGRCQLLLATDVAARGLDIEGLPLVIQLDPAIDADHYVHRAGRTGRMGRKGTVISIITPQEQFIMEKFRKQLSIELDERVMFRGELLSNDQLREATKPQTGSRTNPNAAARPVKIKEVANRTSPTGARAAKLLEEKQPIATDNVKSDQIEKKKSAAAKPTSKPLTKAQVKAERKRDGKNKGAPKWLKEKRGTNP